MFESARESALSEAGLSWVRCEFVDADGLRFITFCPPVVVPSLGHVELDCHGELAIVRTYYASGELSEVRLHNALVREGDTVKVCQLPSEVSA